MLRYKRIYIGSRCDNNCKYCNYKVSNITWLDTQSVIESINERDSLGDSVYDGILLYGGEPILRNDILQLVKEARVAGYKRVKILTNGRLLSYQEMVEQIVNAGCLLFEVKIFGSNPDIHDKITQVSNSFIETVKGLRNLCENQRKKFVCARIQVNRDNFMDLENIVALVIDMMVDRIIISLNDYELSLRVLLPHIKNSINISILNRIWILTEGLRFCNMGGFEKHISELYSGEHFNNEEFVYAPGCNECVLKHYCPGISFKYISIYGYDDFKAVNESNILDDLKVLNA